jgi:hypothetical protein
MSTTTNHTYNIGLIECGVSDALFQLNQTSTLNGYSIKKAFVTYKTSEGILQSQCPKAEIVKDKQAILDDHSIDFILVISPQSSDLNFIREAIQAGKQVRIM